MAGFGVYMLFVLPKKKTMRKNLNLIACTISLIVFLFATSCDDASDDSTLQSVSKTQVQNLVQSGSWKITYFNDSGKDETQDFAGYIFVFGANNVLKASNNAVSYTGQWSISDGKSGDDSPSDIDFNINFNLSNDFEDLSEDWQILSISDTKIELKHVSGGNGGIDFLTFEKV